MTRNHFIEFRKNANLTLKNGGVITSCQIRMGNQTTARVRCYVVCANDQYIEVADIEVPEGKMRGVPCAWFMFIDRMGLAGRALADRHGCRKLGQRLRGGQQGAGQDAP